MSIVSDLSDFLTEELHRARDAVTEANGNYEAATAALAAAKLALDNAIAEQQTVVSVAAALPAQPDPVPAPMVVADEPTT